MKKQMIIPDDLIERVKINASIKHMNFTQYTISALDTMCQSDEFLRAKPDIDRQIKELQASLESLKLDK